MGIFGSSKPKMEVVDYYLSIHYGVCLGPVDRITKITVDKKEAWTGNVTAHSSFRISKRDLFGGNKKEGGVDGVVEYMPGREDQVLSQSLASRLGLTPATAPAYRGITSLFFSGGGVGGGGSFGGLFGGRGGGSGFFWRSNSPYIPGTWVTVERSPKALDPDMRMIGNDANPAAILAEVLTNDDWGMGSPEYALNMQSFRDAAVTLRNEGLGLSILWVQQDTIENFSTTIINHIEGMIYYNPLDGLLTMKLIRDDYDPDTLFTITPDNAELSRFQRKLWGDTSNEIVVQWTNPETEETETVTLQDIGNIAQQGGVVSETKDYTGVRNADLAMKLCTRDLRVAAAPLASCEARVDRSAWKVTPGSCVKVNWPEHGMDGVIMRVGNVDYGSTSDSKINVKLIEDVFSLPQASYTTPPGSEWIDPSETPRPLANHLLMTANYFIANSMVEDVDPAQYPQAVVVALGSQAGTDTSEFSLDYRDVDTTGASSWVDGKDMNLSSRAELDQDIPFEAASTIAVRNIKLANGIAVGDIVVIGNDELTQEMAIVTEVQESLLVIRRGVLDTTPKEWPAQTPVWFIDPGAEVVENVLRTGGEQMTYRMRPRTSRGHLPIADAPDVTVNVTMRPWLPYRPANVRINNSSASEININGAANFDVTWANRNRTTETEAVLAWDAATVTPEEGQTTVIQILRADRTVITEFVDLPGTSYRVPTTDFATEATATLRVLSSVDGRRSMQGREITLLINPTGYGLAYGYNYGA